MESKRINKLFILVILLVAFVVPLFSAAPVLASRSNPTCPVRAEVSCNSGLWSIGNGHTISGFSGQGKVRLWSDMGGGQRVQISKNGVVIENVYPVTGIGAEIDVVATDTLNFQMFDCYSGNCSYPDYGWEPENTGAYANTCGTGCPCPDKSWDGNYAITGSTLGFKSMVQDGDNGNPIGQMQCWGDWAENAWDMDLNDFKMWYTFESTCNCTPVACPNGDPVSKFMTRTIPQGTGLTCNSCVPTSFNCAPLYRNTAPSCSFIPASVSMTRGDVPKMVGLTTVDSDYGDEVSVTSAKVVDSVGNLKSCVRTSIFDGGALENAVVKNDGGSGHLTSQVTSVFLDARTAHGIYENIGGQSACNGFLEVKIADKDSDGAGPDVSNEATCRVAISVTDEAPQLTNISIFDKDPLDKVRDQGALWNGNLVDGRNQLYVGSSITTQSKSRASYCENPLTITDPIRCPGGAEVYESSFSQRRNPLQLEFTVRDTNGSFDIMQAGIWIQRVAQNKDEIALPVVQSGIRNSFQVMYSEMEDMQPVSGNSRWNFISRACLGTNCGPQDLSVSTKQLFSGLAFIQDLGATASPNGNVSQSKMMSASFREWEKFGFPDCLNKISGCTDSNVPVIAQTSATGVDTELANYEWTIGADANHLICFPANSATPTVIPASVPVVTCPVGCAACAKKEGVVPVAGDSKSLTFKFGIYFNDKDGGQGMSEGEYAVFVSALDKTGVPLNNVTGKGDNGWIKFTKNGLACTGATCPNGTDFSLLYDPIAPTVTYLSWSATGLTGANALFSFTDQLNGSGVAGVTNRYMAKQEVFDGEPMGERAWADKVSDRKPFDGLNDKASVATNAITLSGDGLSSGDEIVAGLCVYDKAGNMGCGKNGNTYVFLAPWLKTSYGDVYSAKGGLAPYSQTIPSDDGTTNDNTKFIYEPFSEQIFTAATGILMTSGASGQGTGISGGHLIDKLNLPLGFDSNYRTDSSPYTIYGETPFMQGNEYVRLRAAAISNCDLMNTNVSGSCQSSGSLDTVGLANFNILNSAGGTKSDISCKNVNVIFVTGALEITGQVKKEFGANTNGCIFVLASGASLTVKDTASDLRPQAGDGKGAPSIDKFDAAVIANAGASFQIAKGVRGTNTRSTDRLEIKGWVYSANTVPLFKRDLAPVDNRRYPSEWIQYDASLLDLFRPLLGFEKIVDLTCGTSGHVLCQTSN